MKKRTRPEWLALFESHKQSGLSAAAFCQQNDVCPRYFSLRKKQLLENPSPLIKIQKPVTIRPAELTTIRLQIGDIQIHLQAASPDYVASLLQKLR
jgi:hypothetical protein